MFKITFTPFGSINSPSFSQMKKILQINYIFYYFIFNNLFAKLENKILKN